MLKANTVRHISSINSNGSRVPKSAITKAVH